MAITSPLDISGCVLFLSAGRSQAAPGVITNWANPTAPGGSKNGTVTYNASGGSGGTPSFAFGIGSYYTFTNLMTGAAEGEARYTMKAGVGDCSFSKWGTEGQDAWVTHSTGLYEHYGRNVRHNVGVTATDYHVWCRHGVRSGPGVWVCDRNLSTVFSQGGLGAVAWNTTTYIGSTYGGGVGTNIGMAVGYNRILTTGERADLDAWMVANPEGGYVDLSAISVQGLRTAPGNTTALTMWEDTIGASAYDYRVDGGSPTSVGVPFVYLTGLTNTTTYTVEVRARNGTSIGPWTSVTVTPLVSKTVALVDSYDRADNASSIGTASGTGTYTVRSGTHGISTNSYYAPTNGIITFPASANTEMVAYEGGTGHNYSGLIAHFIDVNNYTCLLFLSPTQWDVYRCSGGSFTSMMGNRTWPNGWSNPKVRFIHTASGYFYVYGNEVLVTTFPNYWATSAVWGVRNMANTWRLDYALAFDTITPPNQPSHLVKGEDTKVLDVASPF